MENERKPPAAPDQPHEFVSWRNTEHLGCCHRKTNGSPCFRPASDPIHQTNEVSDDGMEADAKPATDAADPVHDRGPDRGVCDPEGAAETTTQDGGRSSQKADQPQVTNYDAEAEVRAREGVYVGTGDEVREVETEIVYKVVGLTFLCDDCVWCEDSDGSISWFWFSEIRTPTGQPVLGFREREAPLDGDRLVRIAELERERDEAKAEMRKAWAGCESWLRGKGWVLLDNAAIEQVTAAVYDTANTGARHREMHNHLRSCLRDWRDRRLKEAIEWRKGYQQGLIDAHEDAVEEIDDHNREEHGGGPS